MSADPPRSARLERQLARMLSGGTWLASALIVVGLLEASIRWPGGAATSPHMPLVTAGIALFILMPALRVAWMLIFFLRERDYLFSATAAFVLLIPSVGFAVG